MKYKCDCGYRGKTKADMIYHVEKHQEEQDRELDEISFDAMTPDEQYYQTRMGFVR